MMNRTWLLMPILLIGGALVGCDVQPAVNRVQPNVTRKADIRDGEWYFLSTVVDTPFSVDFTFVGEQGTLERIEWEIQEEFLVARRSYEYIVGSDPEGINGTTDTAGGVVAMYSIKKHFDIKHDYNPVTGEPLNVIVENSTDRPWYERDYMRVDWSKNLVIDPNFMMLSRYFDALEITSMAWDVQEELGPDHPNAPRFVRAAAAEDQDPEDAPLEYMEITNKMFVNPKTINYPGIGPLPACFILQVLDGNPVDCTPSEITVRNSFLRVDPNHEYEPQLYTGDRMDRFGYFVTERPGYDDSYGLIEPLRYRFVNRHNLWVESYKRDSAGDLITCTSDEQCDDGRGSYCDLDRGRTRRRVTDRQIEGACTIPFRDREVRPIVYHTTPNWPEDLLPEARFVASEYDKAFGTVIASLRENECLAHGGSDCSAERTREAQDSIFYVCQTPVPADAPEVCGPEGTVARIGDLRFSLLAYVNEPHRMSPLGYGPSAADPLTGEIIAGNSFIYGAGLETVAAFGRDIVRLLNGDITEEDIASGAPVQEWVLRLSGELRGQSTRTAHDHVIPVDADDVDRINEAMDFSWARRARRPNENRATPTPAQAIEMLEAAHERLVSAGVFGNGINQGDARLGRLRGTEIEEWMTSPEILAMAGIDPGTPLDEDVIGAASPVRATGLRAKIDRLRLRDRVQQHQGVDWGEFADEGLLGLAREITRSAAFGEPITWHGVAYTIHDEDGFIDYEAVRKMLRHPIMGGLALHEIGHTVGLRHNFSGSYDALNYHPKYWELRDDGNMEPRMFDPLTTEEIDGRIYEYSYASVMDYGHNFVVGDAHGLGHYDIAAIKMGYGDLVEVFEEVADNFEFGWVSFIQSAGWPVNLTLETFLADSQPGAYRYTDWPRLVGGRENLERRVDVPYTSLRPDARLRLQVGIDTPMVDAQGRMNVPYRFCSDEQADLSPGCYRYDAGADPYESVQSVIDSYWNYYIFNNFRRARLGFNVNGTANRIYGRYFEKLKRANQIYALYRPIFEDLFAGVVPEDRLEQTIDDFFGRDGGMGSYTAAVGAAYQALTRVIATPEPGNYTASIRGDGTAALVAAEFGDPVDVAVDAFDGRYLETTWDFDAGYFWFDQLERVGYFYDKILALETLADPTTYFLGRDTDADIRRYQLNFASTFGPSMVRFFGGLLGEDWGVFAPRADNGVLVYPDPLQIRDGNFGGGTLSAPIEPNASFSIQLYATVFGMAYIPETYDQEFLHRSRIWVEGGAEAIETTRDLVRFHDPQSGLTYVAPKYDEGGVEHGVGAQLLERANTLKDLADAGDPVAAAELDAFIDNIDLVRRLTWQLGFGAQP